MRPFGIVLVIYIFYLFIKGKNIKNVYISLLGITISIEVFVNAGYFIKIGSYELIYSEVLLIILGIISVYMIIYNSVDKKAFFTGYLFVSSSFYSCLALLVFPFSYNLMTNKSDWYFSFYKIYEDPHFSGNTLAIMLRIVLYYIVCIAAIGIINKENINKVIGYFTSSGKIVLIFITFEFFVKNIVGSNITNNLLEWFFGVGGSTLDKLLVRDTIYTIQGFTREPNHLVSALFWLGLVIIYSGYRENVIKKYLVVILSFMLIARSLAGIIFMASLISIYSIKSKRRAPFVMVLLIIFIFLTQSEFFGYYTQRIYSGFGLFGNFNSNIIDFSGSEQIRLGGIVENIKILQYRPFFGIGFGTIFAHAAIPTILSNIGIIGFVTWLVFIFNGIGQIKITRKNISLISILLATFFLNFNSSLLYSMGLMLTLIVIRTE